MHWNKDTCLAKSQCIVFAGNDYTLYTRDIDKTCPTRREDAPLQHRIEPVSALDFLNLVWQNTGDGQFKRVKAVLFSHPFGHAKRLQRADLHLHTLILQGPNQTG